LQGVSAKHEKREKNEKHEKIDEGGTKTTMNNL